MNKGQLVPEVKVPRILVVDDMPDTLFLMNGLSEDRYELIQAASGKDALTIVMSSNPPDMVLLDIMMPDMDGYEALRRIRQHPPTATIPIVFLTTLATRQDERPGMELGAVDYLTKPIDPELVVKRVEEHVRATAYARRIEALSEKLARQLSPQDWERLFHGPDLETIHFEQKVRTVLYAEAVSSCNWTESERDSFAAEVEWLAVRHRGTVDRFVHGGAAISFDEPTSCVRLAMDLQRCAAELHLRMGIHTGICDMGTFRSGHQACCTLIGPETWLAAQVAASAATGSIAIAPDTYALMKDRIEVETAGCLVTEEFDDTALAQVCLTPAPVKGGADLSTFAGLGFSN
jgi:adenylate cyclase